MIWRETSRARKVTIAVCAGLIAVGISAAALTVSRSHNPPQAASQAKNAQIPPVVVAVGLGANKASAQAGKSPSGTKSAESAPTTRAASHSAGPAGSTSASGSAGSGSSTGGSGGGSGSGASISHVSPGTQGYRGAVSGLAVYSAANRRTPAGGCSWTSDLYLFC